MSEQETLEVPRPADGGLWARFLGSDGAINHAAWLRACAEGGFVGTCRAWLVLSSTEKHVTVQDCGGYLVPRTPEDIGARTDYEANCARCGHAICAAGGAVMRRSARKSESRR